MINDQAAMAPLSTVTLRKMNMNPIRIAKSWISYRRTLSELGSLSNQTLADIGVSRYDIRNIASRSFR
ncbi:uncharacterized protein YjiS (DUF1127 family) [Rhizobium sp. BK176]|nr:uncharacterized protein YjiS (DUF1127 family) [Rhizobium sp. BK181]MBB3543611.1 uncharacterized protein YjiS (DUF1127 family) [Rhizobium sp. BK399]MCS3741851.1 uncharacterized protein YjiS (DUF1127 family) [Rhizobium sp. BK661]MCS4095430.1 uncharacterized protein YjiS (DUF1127 family) [Rhizobium sp. BK176]